MVDFQESTSNALASEEGEPDTGALLKQILREQKKLLTFSHIVTAKETGKGICLLWKFKKNAKFTWKFIDGETVTYMLTSQKGHLKGYALQRNTVKGKILTALRTAKIFQELLIECFPTKCDFFA